MTRRSRVERAREFGVRDVAAGGAQPSPDGPGAIAGAAAPAPRAHSGLERLDISAPDAAIPRVIRNHRRFALTDVTFDGDPVGGATIDAWQNAAGADCWSARVLMVPTDGLAAGALAGRTRDGRLLRGRVARGATGPAPKARGASLVEWHGMNALRADPPAEDA